MVIQLLPSDVIAQIKSATTITSLNGVVCELVKNSLDAQSKKIEISIDYHRGDCIVEDDGIGIHPSEFTESGGLGKLYHTSKSTTHSSLHGGRGTFLASLSAMSLLVITSRHHHHYSHNTLCWHKSEVVSRHVPAPVTHHLPSRYNGTRVTVRDLFGGMPVRVKQRFAISQTQHGWVREWGQLRCDVVLLLLAWQYPVSLILRASRTDQKMVIRTPPGPVEELNQNSRVCRILSQALFLSADDLRSWICVGASMSQLEIAGMISLQPSATKHVQFLSFGIHPLSGFYGHSSLHDDINRIFSNSAFGNEEEAEGQLPNKRSNREPYTMKKLRGTKKGVERWPMFYINIQQSRKRPVEANDIFEQNRDLVQAISELMQVMIEGFLSKNHFRPRVLAGKRAQRTGSGSSVYQAAPSSSSEKELQFEPRLERRKPSGHRGSVSSRLLRDEARPLGGSSCVDPDIVGTKNRLPSPQGLNYKPRSLLDEWSRIKSGVGLNTGGCYKSVRTSFWAESPTLDPQNPTTALGDSTQYCSIGPLLSASGKITRQSFEEAEEDVNKKHLPSWTKDQNDSASGRLEEDGVIAWINPITKSRSSINERTGLAITASQGLSSTVEVRRLSALPGKRLTSRMKAVATDAGHHRPTSNAWIADIVNKWDNPVFRPCEPSIPKVAVESLEGGLQHALQSCSHHCSSTTIDEAFLTSAAAVQGSISKSALRDAEVISQVDVKFILLRLRTSKTDGDVQENASGYLVLVDQHAADERTRIEQFMSDLCEPLPPDSTTKSSIVTAALEVPILFDLPAMECTLLRRHQLYFANWGILLDLPELPMNTKDGPKNALEPEQRVSIHSLPPGILERCKLDPQLVIRLIRTEIWRLHRKPPSSAAEQPRSADDERGWVKKIHDCPKMILDMLNSRACRSSIMFNDELSKEQCRTLIRRLSACVFPFQCAHGRPSMVPLVDLEKTSHHWLVGDQGEEGFGASFQEWRKKLK